MLMPDSHGSSSSPIPERKRPKPPNNNKGRKRRPGMKPNKNGRQRGGCDRHFYGVRSGIYVAQGTDAAPAPYEVSEYWPADCLPLSGHLDVPTIYTVDESGAEHATRPEAKDDMLVVPQTPAEHFRPPLGRRVLEIYNRGYYPIKNNPVSCTSPPYSLCAVWSRAGERPSVSSAGPTHLPGLPSTRRLYSDWAAPDVRCTLTHRRGSRCSSSGRRPRTAQTRKKRPPPPGSPRRCQNEAPKAVSMPPVVPALLQTPKIKKTLCFIRQPRGLLHSGSKLWSPHRGRKP